VRIIKRATLKSFYEKPVYSDSREALEAWYHEVKRAKWDSWAGIKDKYGNASILKDNLVVFNICGNKYRLVVKINYGAGIVFIRFINTHKEYDKINAEKI
jgi:mRNA interferase HigB